MLSHKWQESEHFIRGERDFPVTTDSFSVMLFIFTVMNCCLFEVPDGSHRVKIPRYMMALALHWLHGGGYGVTA